MVADHNGYRHLTTTRSLDTMDSGMMLLAAARWNWAAAGFFLPLLQRCFVATFPTAKVHRTSRRKLGRGQHVQLPAVTAAVTDSADTMTLTFNTPPIVNGNLDVQPVGLTFVSQTQVSPTVWHVLYSGALTTVHYAGIPAGSPLVSSAQGGAFAGIPAGVFS